MRRGDFDALKELVRAGAIFVDVAVLVRRDDDGKLTVDENAHEVAGGTMVGAAAGLLIGLIFPPAVIASTVVGGAAGAGLGGLLSHHREHEIKKDIEDVLPPGSSGIVTVFDITWKPKVDEALAKAVEGRRGAGRRRQRRAGEGSRREELSSGRRVTERGTGAPSVNGRDGARIA